MNPFPELLVSFIGHLMAAHDWLRNDTSKIVDDVGIHLAPTLFVGGTARGLHLDDQSVGKMLPAEYLRGHA